MTRIYRVVECRNSKRQHPRNRIIQGVLNRGWLRLSPLAVGIQEKCFVVTCGSQIQGGLNNAGITTPDRRRSLLRSGAGGQGFQRCITCHDRFSTRREPPASPIEKMSSGIVGKIMCGHAADISVQPTIQTTVCDALCDLRMLWPSAPFSATKM